MRAGNGIERIYYEIVDKKVMCFRFLLNFCCEKKLKTGLLNYFIYVGYLQLLTAMISPQLYSSSARQGHGRH